MYHALKFSPLRENGFLLYEGFLVLYATPEIRPIRILVVNLISDVEKRRKRDKKVDQKFLTRMVNYWKYSRQWKLRLFFCFHVQWKDFFTPMKQGCVRILSDRVCFIFYYHFMLFGTGEISIHLPKPLNVVLYKYKIFSYFLRLKFLKVYLFAFQPLRRQVKY